MADDTKATDVLKQVEARVLRTMASFESELGIEILERLSTSGSGPVCPL